MRRFSLRDYFDRHPATALTIASLALAGWAAVSVKRLGRAQATVHGNWTVTVIIGVAASLAAIGSATGWFWWAYRRRRRLSRAGLAQILGLSGLVILGILVTQQAVLPRFGAPEPVTTTFQLGAIAFMVPFYCGLLALCALALLRLRKTRARVAGRHALTQANVQGNALTAFVSRGRDEGWSVTWFRDGKIPRKLSAPTLTASAERAAAAAVELFANQPATASAELQLAICPGPYQRGPIWEVSGSPGALSATTKDKGRTICTATLEDLVTAIQADPDVTSSDFMLLWTRPITTLAADGRT